MRGLDNGQWTMDNGQWTMDNGQWTMDNGQWTIIIFDAQLYNCQLLIVNSKSRKAW